MEPVLMAFIAMLIACIICLADALYVSEVRRKREIQELKDRIRADETTCKSSQDIHFHTRFKKWRMS
jgi:hypothetical protein